MVRGVCKNITTLNQDEVKIILRFLCTHPWTTNWREELFYYSFNYLLSPSSPLASCCQTFSSICVYGEFSKSEDLLHDGIPLLSDSAVSKLGFLPLPRNCLEILTVAPVSDIGSACFNQICAIESLKSLNFALMIATKSIFFLF